MEDATRNLASVVISVDVSSYKTQNDALLISEVYKNGIFNNFNRYCHTNNLQRMGDLKNFDFTSLSNIRGFGKVRVNRIIARYNSIMFGDNLMPEGAQAQDPAATVSMDDTIDTVYNENKYNIFRQFCSNNGFLTIADLNHLDFDRLLNVDGIGIRKLSQIKGKYVEIMLNNDETQLTQTSNVNEYVKTQNYHIHADYSGIDISFAYEENICEALRKRNIKFIPDVAHISADDFKSITGMGKKRIAEALERAKLFELPIGEFISSSLAQIRSKDEYQCYREVVYNKKTLEKVGIEYGLTRERIRQKKNKIEKYAFPVMELFVEVLMKSGILENIIFFDFEYLLGLIGSYDSARFAKDIFANCELRYIKYSADFDLFFVNENPEEIKTKLRNITVKLGNVFSFVDEMELIEKMLMEEKISFIDVFSFPDYLAYFGYKKYKDYYIKGRASLGCIAEIVMQKYFNNGIKNTSEDIAKLRGYINKEFGIRLSDENDDRNLWVILERPNTNIILWGKSKKIHIDHVIVSDSLLEKIKDRVALELTSIISSDYIFEQVKPLLQITGSNIYCKEALYGVLQYYFSDLFTFKKLTIKATGNNTNIQKMLEDYIYEQGGSVSMASAKEHFSKWTYVMLNTAINLNRNILAWDNGDNLILASSLQLSDRFVSELQRKIDDSFINGYTNGYMIAKNARVLLLKHQIKDNAVSVYSLAKHLFSEKYFFTRRPHILQEYAEKQFTAVDLILMLYKNKSAISYGEMKDRLINDYAMDEVMAGNNIAKAIPYLFQIDIDQYSLPDSITYRQEDVMDCIAYVDEHISLRGYIILSEIDKSDLYRKSVDVSGMSIPINSYIAKSIISKEYPTEYRFIGRKSYDWRYDNLIIVPASSPIITFTDAIIHLLTYEFRDKENFVLSNIEQFLREKELIVNKIPDEFFSSEKITIDEYERVFISKEDQDVVV
ncbi:MAG: hypothetical protein PHR60_06780 [Eubacteriales bacterium]|nr:hypothetical protein [Eubacteriales bacterium]